MNSFPFCHVTLRGRRPREGYPEDPKTLAEHLKRKQLDLGLTQGDVARQVGATVQTVANWEMERTQPEARHYPAILGFLGYDPRPEASTLGAGIKRKREGDGLTQRELARKLGLDPTTLQRWEEGAIRRPYPRLRRLFEEYVEGA